MLNALCFCGGIRWIASNPHPPRFLADSFFHHLLFAGLQQFQERALFPISGWCVTLWTMGPSASEKSLNSLPQHHSVRIRGDRHSHLGLCFLKPFPDVYIFLCMKIRRLLSWSCKVLLTCNNILDLLQPYQKMFQTSMSLQSASNVRVIAFIAQFWC